MLMLPSFRSLTIAITSIVLNLLFFHVGRRPSPDVTRDAAGRMLTLEDVNAMDQASFLRTFSPLFNNATWPLERAHAVGPFATVQDLRDAVQDAVLTAPREQHEVRALIEKLERGLARIHPGAQPLEILI